MAQSFDISGSPEPVSSDLDLDRTTLAMLVELAQSRKPLNYAFLDGLKVAVTPWVAWQLGVYTEWVAFDTEYALEVVRLALWAASRSKDQTRVLANLLTAANTCFRAGKQALAEDLYEEILVSPLSANTSERLGAFAGMANLNLLQENFRDAAYYFDKCLISLHLFVNEQGRQGMLANAARCYLQCKDMGGALVSLTHLNADHADMLEKQLRTQPPSLDERLLIIARLHVLGAGSMADKLFATWNKEALPT